MPKKVKTWYLQMLQSNHALPAAIPNVEIVRVKDMPLIDYLTMFQAVGGLWDWSERLKLSPSELAAIIHNPMVEIYQLWADGKNIGFGELDLRVRRETELKYLGLIRASIGRGLGRYFLNWLTATTWSRQPAPTRFWLHTCTGDHPKALEFYQKGGFQIYDIKFLDE